MNILGIKSILATLAVIFIASIDMLAAQNYTIPEAKIDLKAKSVEELWDLGNTAYVNDDYIGAEQFYSEILSRDIHSASLYYNLGNVYQKSGEIGKSLLNYYRALRLNPSDEDIRHNIEIAKSKTSDNIEPMPRLFIVEWSESIGAQFSCMEWSIMSLILLAIALGFLLFYLLAEMLKMRRLGFLGVVIFTALFAITTRYALIKRAELMNPSEAIIMSRSLTVSSSPNNSSTELFILHEGTKVRVLTRIEGWCEIMIDDGKKGWVECKRIETI